MKASEVIADVKGILADEEGGSFDAATLLDAVNFASTHMAMATRFTMERVAIGLTSARRYALPPTLLDLDTVYLKPAGGGNDNGGPL